MSIVRFAQAGVGRLLAVADAAMNRLYGWRGNPLYQSGTIGVLAFVVMLATGLYLLLFYRVGDPYTSMLRIDGQLYTGRWIRSMHRYAADIAVVAAAVHAVRMFVQGKTWGPRLLAWLSGLVLLFLMFVCGWTGYVMVWDEQAIVLAKEGARLFDVVPIFSEPLARAFVGERALPAAFFFLNLFAHVALPIGVALLLWIHVSRVARPILLPPRGLTIATVGALLFASVLMPSPLGREADPFGLPEVVTLDWFYNFWLPFTRTLSPQTAWVVFLGVTALVVAVPWWTRPTEADRPRASMTAPNLCTGCFQCSYDCPYGAIDMIRIETRDHEVASVDPTRCVTCGICSGSCAPMAVGPPAWSGRDEVADVRAFTAGHALGAQDVVVIACEHGAGRVTRQGEVEGALVYPARCAGNLHTSVIEFLLRAGAGGVLVATCPPRDCRGREGPKWLDERMYHGREAELRESLDRRRLRVAYAGPAERGVVLRALAGFRQDLADLSPTRPELEVELDAECEGPPPIEAVS